MRKDSIILPDKYEVSINWDVRVKEHIVKSKNWKQWVVKQHQTKCSNEMNWYYRVHIQWDWIRKNILLHRLVYCTFNNIHIDTPIHIGHHNDNAGDNRLDNLYATNPLKNTNNKKLAYKLLELYKQWLITLPQWYDIDTEL